MGRRLLTLLEVIILLAVIAFIFMMKVQGQLIISSNAASDNSNEKAQVTSVKKTAEDDEGYFRFVWNLVQDAWFGRSASDNEQEFSGDNQTGESADSGNAENAVSFSYRYPVEEYDETFYANVPILMYHVVEDGPNSLYLKPEDFQAQLDYFEENGIHPITMKELYSHWINWTPLPKHPIVLTFDDGYRSMYTEAYPRLKAKGYPGVFYIYTSVIGQDANLTEDMIREMSASGMEIGSHTVNHLDLSTLSADNLRHELNDSRTELQSIIGTDVVSLCYPSGRYTDTVRSIAEECGYFTAVTTDYQVASNTENLYQLSRIRVSLGDGAGAIKSKLQAMAEYNW